VNHVERMSARRRASKHVGAASHFHRWAVGRCGFSDVSSPLHVAPTKLAYSVGLIGPRRFFRLRLDRDVEIRARILVLPHGRPTSLTLYGGDRNMSITNATPTRWALSVRGGSFVYVSTEMWKSGQGFLYSHMVARHH
jgi:hypothetical protein